MTTSSGAYQINKQPIIDTNCIVEFRPQKGWNGEYGFDWYRKDSDFEEIDYLYSLKRTKNGIEETVDQEKRKYNYDALIGIYNNYNDENSFASWYGVGDSINFQKKHYCENYQSFNFKIINFRIKYSNSFFRYYVPWLCVPKNLKIRLLLLVKVVHNITHLRFESGENITIECSNMLNHNNVLLKKIDSREMTIDMQIESTLCDEQYIEVYARNGIDGEEALAGRLCIAKNEKIIAKYNFINVMVQATNNACSADDSVVNSNINEEVNRILSQACVSISLSTNRFYSVCIDDSSLDLNGLTKGMYADVNKKNLASELIDKLPAGLKNRLEKTVVFYIPKSCKKLRGFAVNVHNHSVIILFKSNNMHLLYKAFAHEFSHSFGLLESWMNVSSLDARREVSPYGGNGFAFKKEKTNNLMDYSCGFILWHWQWEIIRKQVKNSKAHTQHNQQ